MSVFILCTFLLSENRYLLTYLLTYLLLCHAWNVLYYLFVFVLFHMQTSNSVDWWCRLQKMRTDTTPYSQCDYWLTDCNSQTDWIVARNSQITWVASCNSHIVGLADCILKSLTYQNSARTLFWCNVNYFEQITDFIQLGAKLLNANSQTNMK